jgi:hypothetical protein
MNSLKRPLIFPQLLSVAGEMFGVILDSEKASGILKVQLVSERSGRVETLSLDPVDPKQIGLLEFGEIFIRHHSIQSEMLRALIESGTFEEVPERSRAWIPGSKVWRVGQVLFEGLKEELESNVTSSDEIGINDRQVDDEDGESHKPG